MISKRIPSTDPDRDLFPVDLGANLGVNFGANFGTNVGAGFGTTAALRPSSSGRAAAAVVIPPEPEDDVDRASEGIATGNVITGAGTLSGALGKDHGGSGALSFHDLGLTPGGTVTYNGSYGDAVFDGKGNYTYTRTVPIDVLPVGAYDVFVYEIIDSKGNVSASASLRVLLDPLMNNIGRPVLFNGTNYDDAIDVLTGGGKSLISGLGGDDIIRNMNINLVKLDGGAGDDVLVGGLFSDFLIGGPGADQINGSSFAVLSYETSAKDVAVNLTTGTGTLGDALGDTISGIANMRGGKGNDTLTGDGQENGIVGGAGNDTIGGGGNNDGLSGEDGNDILLGSSGNDTLDGGAGADHMDGGADTDTVVYSDATGILLDLGSSTKSTGSAKGDTFAGVEQIRGTIFNDTLIVGSVSFLLHGHEGDDTVIGGAAGSVLYGDNGDDTLIGGAGADIMDGGTQTDRVSYEKSKSAVEFSLGGGGVLGDAAGDIYFNVEIGVGSSFNDSIFASGAFKSQLNGGAGDDYLGGDVLDDVLVGGAGSDTLDGAGGTDTASYLGGKAVTVDLGDTLKSTGDAKGDSYILIEAIEGSGFADTLIGDSGGNTFRAAGGNDKVNGGGGADALDGDDGNDTLAGEADGDVLHGGAGTDKLDGGAGQDSLFGDDGNDTLLGGDDADVLSGGLDADKLDGGAGDDTLYGNVAGFDLDTGKDTLSGGLGDDVLHGGLGDDKLDGGIGNDQLLGDEGNDTLNGGAGDDILEGSYGKDTLTGGAGVDRFVFESALTGDVDKILDFDVDEDILVFKVTNGSGGDIQDLADAGITATSSGSTLTIAMHASVQGQATIVIGGWTGGQVDGDIQSVAMILGSHLQVTH